jgi:hypothetical protein
MVKPLKNQMIVGETAMTLVLLANMTKIEMMNVRKERTIITILVGP